MSCDYQTAIIPGLTMHDPIPADECAGCFRPIRDRFLLKVLDKPWHASCVRCELCRKLLDEKCFYKEGKMYCKDDFYRCFGPKCGGCGEKIHYQDFVRKARDKVYHLRCFTCSICAKQLSTGEVLYLQPGDEGFVCRDHYLKQDISFSDDDDDIDDPVSLTGLDHSVGPLTATPPHLTPAGSSDTSSLTPTSPSKYENNNNLQSSQMDKEDKDDDDLLKGDDDSKEHSDGGDGAGGKRRGPRTTIKAKQLEVLKTAFSQTPKPTRHIREQLAKETGLSMRVIQVWFQNKRSKERRMKQMTSGMMAGRGFFPPGKGGRRGFPMIGDEFGYFPHDKPFHDFGYGPQNFGPPPGEGFFPGPPLGFMGGHPGGPPPNMEPGSMHGGPMGGPMGGPPQGPPLPPHPGNGESPFPPGSMLGGDSGDSRDFSMGDGMTQPPRPSPSEFQNSQGGSGSSSGFSSDQGLNEQMVW